ncbi:hypothetical protein GCM10009557_89600 [Virgisporangium ochraceum]|uniref:Uncharacterized protein n=1 Tax=Virgisporangium ochraceum TaxID=65505 RepID=A0A8J4A1Y5_9ACTN|nr:hypothetical protein [Virgisporangium ochraceum]GIJ74339.1 hypothetical protein Voc01_092560 [Virgisporangium ochraceum]
MDIDVLLGWHPNIAAAAGLADAASLRAGSVTLPSDTRRHIWRVRPALIEMLQRDPALRQLLAAAWHPRYADGERMTAVRAGPIPSFTAVSAGCGAAISTSSS